MKSGDLGFLDDEGYLHLTGRAKDLIIRGGVNISPVEIDGVLMQRPEVVEACTVGVPDRLYGEEVVAYVVLRAGTSIGADEILRHCQTALPGSHELGRSNAGRVPDRATFHARYCPHKADIA
jgi:acyl-CoA synthetase (AMP-forming)/AMP-acid ligase II